jgi:hypothetical protein
MEILQYQRKGAHLNTVERFYIHAEYTANNHLNDSQNIFPSAIFHTLLATHLQQKYNSSPTPHTRTPPAQSTNFTLLTLEHTSR